MLMCRVHWSKVPRKVQAAVYETYRVGQCDDMRPSKEWHRAADAAIGYVAKCEGLGFSVAEAEAMAFFGFADKRIKEGLAKIAAAKARKTS